MAFPDCTRLAARDLISQRKAIDSGARFAGTDPREAARRGAQEHHGEEPALLYRAGRLYWPAGTGQCVADSEALVGGVPDIA
eukprot:2411890-Rhodomonas_salina.1